MVRIAFQHIKRDMMVAVRGIAAEIRTEAEKAVEEALGEDGFGKKVRDMVRRELDMALRDAVRDIVRKVVKEKQEELEVHVAERLAELLREDQVRDMMES